MDNKETKPRQPKIFEVREIPLPPVEVSYLDNGIPVYTVNTGKLDAIRLEIIFTVGRPHELKTTVARATSALLKEGSLYKSSAQIAEHFDFYGGSLSTPFSLDYSSLIMYSLTKHIDKLLPVFAELIHYPAFSEKELSTYVENNINDLKVELSKNDVLSYRKLTESIFGARHPYGYNSSAKALKGLTRADLQQHFETYFHAGNAVVMASGNIPADLLTQINNYLGNLRKGERAAGFKSKKATGKPKQIFISRKDSHQTAIAMGRRLFTRAHEDYAGMFVLNTILGGYFGSRLMDNIREEKGYTYNIYSSVEHLMFDGFFYVSTEVGNEFSEKVITEIEREMEKLQQEEIGKAEMKMVRNYILGNLLNMADGPFNIADLYKTYIVENIDISEFKRFVQAIMDVQPAQLRELARKYLCKEDMWQVVAGVRTDEGSVNRINPVCKQS
jgi:predicted Zn-dependent peptidase